ncbi:UvrD-helicase domain-containing protein [Paraburkholderia caledonica]|uniref:UvrD-helicase domain-containing protein n=1 Tax=Paraburkholderia caledonica TaxID=134536 RepID=UPI0038B7C06F
MEFSPTKEQSDIINADLSPQCVIACPGSGKTATAVRRLLEIRKRLSKSRGHMALFSYSNVAVETFRQKYRELSIGMPTWANRVLIETADSFLTTYILRPHGVRVMEASWVPFFVTGNEPFLNGARIYDGKYPHNISELRIRWLDSGDFEYSVQSEGRPPIVVEREIARTAIRKVGRMGAYTYELARYWSMLTLARERPLLEALARRFPHLLVDEAQDIVPLHGILISLLASRGTVVSLIGDPNQGIYDFAGADGTYLRDYATANGTVSFPLSQNRRSMGAIVMASNSFAATVSTPFRTECDRTHGCFYLRYDESNLEDALATFKVILESNRYSFSEGIVLSRATSVVDRLRGSAGIVGQGATEKFARAALARDRALDMATSFENAVVGLLKLLATPGNSLHRDLLDTSSVGDVRALRRLLWGFVRNAATGLPDARLPAKSKWHSELKKRLAKLLDQIESETAYRRSATWSNNVTLAKVGNEPMWKTDLAQVDANAIRIDTVHQAKGEGIPAVFFLARTADLNKLLGGMGTEEGRIGYVAVTRAENLLIIAVPSSASKTLVEGLEAKGCLPWPH